MGLSQLADVIDDDQLKQILECRPTEKGKNFYKSEAGKEVKMPTVGYATPNAMAIHFRPYHAAFLVNMTGDNERILS